MTNEIDRPYLPGTVGILVLLGNLAKDAKDDKDANILRRPRMPGTISRGAGWAVGALAGSTSRRLVSG